MAGSGSMRKSQALRTNRKCEGAKDYRNPWIQSIVLRLFLQAPLSGLKDPLES